MSAQYRVNWHIDLEAASPEDAARQALAIHRNPDRIATVFDVSRLDPHSTIHRIDLTASEKDPPAGEPPGPTDAQYRHAAQLLHADDDDTQIDAAASVSRGDDDGAYVQAWLWIPRKELSLHAGVDCAHCDRAITEESDGHSTFCGSMHTDCITAHGKSCEACRNELC